MKSIYLLSLLAMFVLSACSRDIQREEEYDQDDITGGTNTTTSPTSGQQ